MPRYESKIEKFFQERNGKEAIYLPSGRLASYLALSEWLEPGAQVLISPLSCDVLFFSILAAGMRPVFGPVNPMTGNLAASEIDDQTWASLDAVMTINMYGIPDEMDVIAQRCKQHQLLLIEDCCQAIDSHSGGQQIGTFGELAFFSLTKHLDGQGAVLTFEDPAKKEKLEGRLKEILKRRSIAEKVVYRGRGLVRETLEATGLLELVRRLTDDGKPPPAVRKLGGHRMPFTEEDLLELSSAKDISQFDRWLRRGLEIYRTLPMAYELSRSLRGLKRLARDRRRRLEGIQKLQRLNLIPAFLTLPQDIALLRVPFFVEDRERVLQECKQLGLKIDCIYDPPLDELLQSGHIRSLISAPEAINWSQNVLPVNPLDADAFIEVMHRHPNLLRPVWSNATKTGAAVDGAQSAAGNMKLRAQ